MNYAVRQAVRLLESCANQGSWEYGLHSTLGFSLGARHLAVAAVSVAGRLHSVDGDSWRLGYAEAAALLRSGWRPGQVVRTLPASKGEE